MQTLFGILALIAGVIFPMAMVGWLAFRMSKKPPIAPNRVGLILAFNGVLPIGLVLLGLGQMSPALWAMAWVRAGTLTALGGAGLILLALILSARKRST